jgi:asparagine synthase (glutamine-hydrolysing)
VSALTGVFALDGAPVPAGVLEAMTGALAHRAHRPWIRWGSGSVAFAAAGTDAGPARDPARGLTVVFDGRIDNAADLAREAGDPSLAGPALLLALYARRGAEAVGRILGDFAFVIHDAAAARLVCARDYLGQRPLFYSAGGGLFAFASEMAPLLRLPGVGSGINEAMVAEYLTGLPATVHETLWRGVLRLPPAHVLIADRDGVNLRRYWDFTIGRSAVATPRERNEAFRELFTDAVACRVRDVPNAGVLLSGGVDSSAVAGVLQAVARRNGGSAHALSFTFPGLACDETPFIDAVVRHTGMETVRIESPAVTLEAALAEMTRHVDFPLAPTGTTITEPLKRRARQLGIETVLTGCGGDEWFTGWPPAALELLAAGRVSQAARALADTVRSRRGTVAKARGFVGALLPDFLRRRRTARAIHATRPTPWIRPSFAEQVALRDRLEAGAAAPFPTPARRAMHAFSRSALQVMALEAEDRGSQACGLAESHPFYDRRLVEFGFDLPNEACWKDGLTKGIVRDALTAHLPPEVAARADKAEFSEVFVCALESLGGARLFEHLRAEEAGWVDGEHVRARYAKLMQLYRSGDAAYSSLVDGMWEVAGLELWLEHIAGTREPASAPRPELP